MKYTFYITPMGKPRMTRSDAWRKRECVVRYFAYKDELVKQAKKMKFSLKASGQKIVFYIPMPKSWSQKKRDRMIGKPHQQRIDIDNAVKGIYDSLCDEDSFIWQINAEKRWGEVGKIEVIEDAVLGEL